MATIQKRKNTDGSISYKGMIRAQDGFPPAYKTFSIYQEAKDWGIQEEAKRRRGLYQPDTLKQKTLGNLIEACQENVISLHPDR